MNKYVIKYSLYSRMIRRWKPNEFIQTAAKSETSRKRNYGAGRKILLKNIENEIFDWIMEKRNKKLEKM